MMNILIPIAGKSRFFNDDSKSFPKPLYEICGKPMIQHTLENLLSRMDRGKFIFILRKDDCEKYHLHNTISLLVENDPVIIKQAGETRGAACSCLLAIEEINNTDELIICNSDQILNINIQEAIKSFRETNADAGVICFESVHPQWSYVRTESNGKVVEAAEKNPISKNAIAGIYYFRKGAEFVQAAQKMILKDANINGQFFIAPCLNELILSGKNVYSLKIDRDKYHSFYSIDKIKEFETLKDFKVRS